MSLAVDLLRTAARKVATSAPVLAVRRHAYERRFAGTQGWRNLARGIYSSFEEARRDAPATMPVGYVLDDAGYAETASIESHDYPALFWLRPALEKGCTLVDFGGHFGLQYFLYGRFVRYAPDTRWVVSEQSHVVKLGLEHVRGREAAHLSFVDDPTRVAADVFHTSGCIQTVEEPFADLLRRLPDRPRAVLVNKVPLYERETRVTLQNTGRSFTPYYLFNAREFIGSIESLGYRLVDRWQCLNRSMKIPFHREHAVTSFSGLYFEADR